PPARGAPPGAPVAHSPARLRGTTTIAASLRTGALSEVEVVTDGDAGGPASLRRGGGRRRRGRVEWGADAGPGAALGGGARRRRAPQRPGRGRARAAGTRGDAAGRAPG